MVASSPIFYLFCFRLPQAAVSSVVDGLFNVLVTLGVVPIIRCPKVRPSHEDPRLKWHRQLHERSSLAQCIQHLPASLHHNKIL